MPFWFSTIYDLRWSVRSPNYLLNDLISVAIFTFFSCIQLGIMLTIMYHLCFKLGASSKRPLYVFGLFSVFLGACFLVSCVLQGWHFALQLSILAGVHERQLPADSGTSLPLFDRGACNLDLINANSCQYGDRIEEPSICRSLYGRLDAIATLELASMVILHAQFLLSDMVMICRCYSMLRKPRIMAGFAALLLLTSIGVFLRYLIPELGYYSHSIEQGYADGIRFGACVSQATNLVVYGTLIFYLQRAYIQEKCQLAEPLAKRNKVSYSRLTKVLLLAAIPPLLFAIVHGFTRSITVGALWASSALLGPQMITLYTITSGVPLNGDMVKQTSAPFDIITRFHPSSRPPTSITTQDVISDEGATGLADSNISSPSPSRGNDGSL